MFDIHLLREYCQTGSVYWSEHIALRMAKRGIQRKQVLTAIQTGTVIEDYPDDYPYPSCLILGTDEEGKRLHVVCGIGDEKAWMITAYYPDTTEWEDDMKTRKGPVS